MKQNFTNDRRLIEDYLPIKAISKEASREKSIRKGHICTLHLWWARRPLVACRAAVYGTLVPADQFRPKNGPPEKRNSLGRANAAKFLERLCKYPGNPQVIREAERHILESHAERLTKETGEKVSLEDIEQGRAPRPKVLDMFAGGGAIPLEALRLGCEAYALDLNPVAHIIELCTLVYPQKYGKPDPNAIGMTGPENDKGETTWGGLADEVRFWGNWVLEKVREEIGDLYPPILDPEYKGETPEIEFKKGHWVKKGKNANCLEEWAGVNNGLPEGYLTSVAYLWSRTVQCKNPSCSATVPLVKQTWLSKKKAGKKSLGRYVALKILTPKGENRVRFEIVEATTEKDLGFDPSAGSKGGNATCFFCGTVANNEYVKEVGNTVGFGHQPMIIICNRPGRFGKAYVEFIESDYKSLKISERLTELSDKSSVGIPDEILEANPRSFDVQRYGFSKWKDIFTDRQLLMHLTIVEQLRQSWAAIRSVYVDVDIASAIYVSVAVSFSRLVTSHNSFAYLHSGRSTIEGPFGDAKFPMTWDFVEPNMFSGASASYSNALDWVCNVYELISSRGIPAVPLRGSATTLPFENEVFDAVVTDPPYYDNVTYSNLSDPFYVWLKRSLGYVLPEHFSSSLTPKKKEAIKATYRHLGDAQAANRAYEVLMADSLREAHRVLKPDAVTAIVYAHKTTLGWSTLVDALRESSFTIVEAWPMTTEMKAGRKKFDKAMLASSVFLVARKRKSITGTGNYENCVQPELEQIVRERVDTFWNMGIAGADLVIAAVGAGLRPFTSYARVEYANGEEVPAKRFLAEVETIVLETILRRLSKEVGGNSGQFSLAGVDSATRFYILWRYTYKYSVLDAGEAIVFANGTHVELDGPNGLSIGTRALLEKKKGKYRLIDFSDRGSDKKLGQMMEDGQPAPMIDALHRTLWLMEKRPGELPAFLQAAQPNREQMRLVAQALAGPALKGGELGEISPHAELSALAKLTANWKSVIEGAVLTVREKKAEERGQRRLF